MKKRHQHKRSVDLPLKATRPRRRPFERNIKRGTPYRGIIGKRVEKEFRFLVDLGLTEIVEREFTLHATKGYRSTRA